MSYDRLLDAENSISHLGEFVSATWQTWAKKVQFGTYNVTNPGYVTTRQVATWIEESGICKKQFQFLNQRFNF